MTLKDLTDAVLYLGPIGTLATLPVPEELWEDDAFWEELDRRHRIHPGGPLNPMIRASKGQDEHHR